MALFICHWGAHFLSTICYIFILPKTLYLTYFEGMSYLQAAEVMGKSVKQITNMVYRGKERLRGLLEREGITNVEP